ncbi:MAG: RtcB family protein [Acidimicrobiales bacterium]|nr:RtcB family protein [Acidimicrobiales bacterium]
MTMQIRTEGGVERVRSWAADIEENTMEQALRSARCDAVSGPVALMADAHFGLGATVGSVIPTGDAIIPAAVGVDIGCGMIAVETNVSAHHLPDNLGPILRGIGKAIPSGFDRHQHATKAADQWSGAHPLQTTVSLTTKQQRTISQQLGSLGGGNHFVEVCIDERDVVWAGLHSGSRGIGSILAKAHIEGARTLCRDLERALEDRDLAYFLQSDDGFQAYVADMLWAQDYALENREQMMNALLRVLRHCLDGPVRGVSRINCHHNYTERETHDGVEQWITRKGAIRAAAGDRGVIPGSMGTNSYIVTGRGNPAAYMSAAHGAGRRFGRKEAKRRFTTEQFAASMEGRTWQRSKAESLLDEAPMAYKDIEMVMAAQADLVSIDHELHAVVNYRGA